MCKNIPLDSAFLHNSPIITRSTFIPIILYTLSLAISSPYRNLPSTASTGCTTDC